MNNHSYEQKPTVNGQMSIPLGHTIKSQFKADGDTLNLKQSTFAAIIRLLSRPKNSRER
jgi:hypothetical protein